MTREEAIKSALKYLVHKQQEQGSWGYADNDDTNKVSWNEVLEWIDQQPCGDLISRQAVLETQAKYAEHMGATKFWQMRDNIRALPPVTPQPKIGHWISIDATHSKCDRCGAIFEIASENGEANYCPNCRAKMEVDE